MVSLEEHAPMRVGYMTGEYLRVSPFVFIHREIDALREQGLEIKTISIRGLRKGDELTSPEHVAEADRTFVVIPRGPLRVARDHLKMLFRNPGRYLHSLRLAARTHPPGIAGCFKQLAYFLEAGVVAAYVARHEIRHLHNHLHSSSCTVAMLAAELAGVSYSWMIHGVPADFGTDYWRLEEKTRTASFVASASQYGVHAAMSNVSSDLEHKLHVVRCGIDPDQFQFQSQLRGNQRLVFTGRIARDKGVHVLLDSMKLLRQQFPKVSLVMVGDGPERVEIESRLRSEGLTECVTITGYVNAERVHQELQQADVFVLPSFRENIPVSLMEAMATGIPVVTTSVGGIAELVHDEISGLVCEPRQAQPIANQVRRLLQSKELSEQLRHEARRTVESSFNIHREPLKLLPLFENSVGTRPRR